jgi:integrase
MDARGRTSAPRVVHVRSIAAAAAAFADALGTPVRVAAPAPLWAGRQTLTSSEAHRVLVANPGIYQSAFALGLLLGLRKNEVLALRRTDYDPVAATLTIRSGPDTGKTPARPRVLPVTSSLGPYLAPRVAEARDLLFPSAAGGVRGPRAKLHERVRSGETGGSPRGLRAHLPPLPHSQ